MNLKDTLESISDMRPKKPIELTSGLMPAYVITMMNNSSSLYATRKLLNSIRTTNSQVSPIIWPATVPETIIPDIVSIYGEAGANIKYTWPQDPSADGIDYKTGLYKRAYKAVNVNNVIACAVSHMKLWKHCVDTNTPIMILEHDAIFTQMFEYSHLFRNPDANFENGGICGLNDPRGATRKAKVFFDKAVAYGNKGVFKVPSVDEIGDDPLPQGLAGNSAYVIKPFAAKQLLDKVIEIGIWPNDALMCKQLFPWMRISVPFYTTVQQQGKSTTTG